MNNIAIVKLSLSSFECDNCCSQTMQVVQSAITDWQEVSDSDLMALERHLGSLSYDQSQKLVLVRQLDKKTVENTVEECLAKVREAEQQAQRRREAAERAARKAEATKVERESKRKIKQFEKLKKDLVAEGVLTQDGAVAQKHERRR